MLYNILILLALHIILVSCGSIQKVAVATTGSIIYEASPHIESETSFESFQKGIPGSLKLAEAFWYLKQDDEDSLVSLIKGYTGYAFVVNETFYLNDQLLDVDESPHKDQAIINYTKSMQYGMKFLEQNDVPFSMLVEKMKENDGIKKLLESEFSDDLRDLEGVMFTAQSLSCLINLQKDKVSLYAYVPIAKAMYDWVCSKNPQINHGACDIFYGSYEASRPSMLGGNPKKGKEHFLKAIKNHPYNWLARVMYIQHYLIPMSDDEGYAQQKEFFEINSRKYHEAIKWNPDQSYEQRILGDKRMRLYQMMALKRFEFIKKNDKDLF